MCKKISQISITRQPKTWTIFFFTHTPIKHHNKTPFKQNLFTQNVTKKNIKVAKFLNLKNENETKNKNLSI
jgi:hypothetical protein